MTMLLEPFAPLFELSRELNRLATDSTRSRAFVPATDVVMTDEHVTVVMDVPGFKPGDIDVELTDDVLTVRGERTLPYETDGDGRRTWQRLERGFGTFERVLRVPKGLDADSIQADMTDGVLTLQIPVVTPTPKRIEISTGGVSQPVIEQDTTSEQREPVAV